MMADRADPLGDISDFAPTAPRPKPPVAKVRKVAEANGFTGNRAPPPPPSAPPSLQRRYRTGRNTQLNLKLAADTIARFTAIADRENWRLAETFEHALEALEHRRK